METNNIQPRADLADSADVAQETTKSLLEHARVKNIVSDGVFIKAYSVPKGVKLYTKQFATDHVTILAQGSVYIDGPDYKVDPEDDFSDAANSEWVRDTVQRLASALANGCRDE
jgi:hypothetical protein